MERTKETLEARVRETPLVDRLKECRQRIGNMCAELRGPKMSIPVEYYDDDFYICTTLADAQATVEALQRVRDEFEHERDQLHAALMEAKAALNIYRATLDAMTPAPDTSIIGKCEPPSQWDPNAQVRGDIS